MFVVTFCTQESIRCTKTALYEWRPFDVTTALVNVTQTRETVDTVMRNSTMNWRMQTELHLYILGKYFRPLCTRAAGLNMMSGCTVQATVSHKSQRSVPDGGMSVTPLSMPSFYYVPFWRTKQLTHCSAVQKQCTCGSYTERMWLSQRSVTAKLSAAVVRAALRPIIVRARNWYDLTLYEYLRTYD